MKKYQNKYRIEPIRMDKHDYSSPGGYFITICIQNRKNILGYVKDSKMILSEYGKIVKEEFLNMETYHRRIIMGEWVVMPNHIHCIIMLGEYDYDNKKSVIGDDINKHADEEAEIKNYKQKDKNTLDDIKLYRKKRRRMLLFKALGKMKMLTSKKMNILRATPAIVNWQKGYYEHVIRNNDAFERIKYYIRNNPRNLHKDKFNGKN